MLFFFSAFSKRKTIKEFQYCVRLFYNGKEVDEVAYFDSGNILYDNITNRPIVLISPSVFEKLTGNNYFEFVLKETSTTCLKNCHYVPASTAMSQGKMLVFEVDKLQIIVKNKEVKEHKNIFLVNKPKEQHQNDTALSLCLYAMPVCYACMLCL